MDLTILGNNSALPNHDRFPTAQILRVGSENFLIDCGEGTQVRLQRHGIKISKISKIFISHLHGDHYFGLIGLLTRLSLNNHPHAIDIYSPALLRDIIELQFKASGTKLCFDLRFHFLTKEEIIIDNDHYQVHCFPTEHRIECYGFTFIEKPSALRKLNIEACQQYSVPLEAYAKITHGADYSTSDGHVIPNHLLTYAPVPAKKYAYCADTRYTEIFLDAIRDADVLYHETTYLSEENELAYLRYHSTTFDAAKIAQLANASQLIIGHFSSKYKYLDQFLEECRPIFSETYLSFEGQNIII